jgi:hypothetical protein
MGLVIHANSITLTPGTIAVEVAPDEFLVHALTREGADGLAGSEMDFRLHPAGRPAVMLAAATLALLVDRCPGAGARGAGADGIRPTASGELDRHLRHAAAGGAGFSFWSARIPRSGPGVWPAQCDRRVRRAEVLPRQGDLGESRLAERTGSAWHVEILSGVFLWPVGAFSA